MTPSFGVTPETKSNNSVNYDTGGIKKAYLNKVGFEEVGKDTKYNVLSFDFTDVEGVKTFRHVEFIIKLDDAKFNDKLNALNVRIKHIWEAYAPFPTSGIGVGAKDFEDFFQKVADAFNTGNAGKPIYKIVDGEKEKKVLTYIKVVFNKQGNIAFPYAPNFIEKYDEHNKTEAKKLTINNKYDVIEQPRSNSSNMMGMPGGGTPVIPENEF